ncbi:MAG TPA: hypothetical protein PKD54_10235 [Pirellulaceae bacterium]|nr:hypothetical protein [Pirellulaceae bacterium]
MWKYIKRAFLNHWNLLVFGSGVAFGLLSGQPDVVLPLVVAGEVAYLGLLATHPKFQRYVEAQDHKNKAQQRSVKNQEIMKRIIRALPQPMHQRYENIRYRCRELTEIARDLKQPDTLDSVVDLDDMRAASLDRLLWVFLRLLFTQYSLERFLDTISTDTLQREATRLERQLQDLDSGQLGPQHDAKIRRAIEDNLVTLRERMNNAITAETNHRYVKLELDRLENKIMGLAEMAVNRQDPNFISSQVDAVADSVRESERTMTELQYITGLNDLDDQAPEMLRQPVTIN